MKSFSSKLTLVFAFFILVFVGTPGWILVQQQKARQIDQIKDLHTLVAQNAAEKIKQAMDQLAWQMGQGIDCKKTKFLPSWGDSQFTQDIQVQCENQNTLEPQVELAPSDDPVWIRVRLIVLKSRFEFKVRSVWIAHFLEGSLGTQLYLVTPQSALLAYSQMREADLVGPKNFSPKKIIDELNQSKPAGASDWIGYREFEMPGFGSQRGVFVSTHFQSPLWLGVLTPQNVVTEVIQQLIFPGLLALILSIVGGIALSLLLSRQISKPIRSLSRRLREFTKGGEFQTDPQLEKRKDEVGDFSRAFHEMTQTIGQLQEEKLRRQRLVTLSTFSAALSHEIKNPLGAIHGHTQVFSRSLAGFKDLEALREKVRSYLEIAATELNRTFEIMQRLARFSKEGSEPELVPIKVGPVVQNALDPLKSILDQAQIEVSVLGSKQTKVLGDAGALSDLFSNLIRNACEAMEGVAVKKLEIEITQDREFCTIEFRDTGSGLAKEILAGQAGPLVTTKETGTGLGLALARAIADAHRGSLTLKPRAGGGVVAALRVPLAAE